MKISLPQNVAAVIARLEERGFEAYAVGGCVRDSLLGREIHDWDVASSATASQLRECFSGEKLIPTGEKHGTMTLLSEGMPIEITTFRVDGSYSDGRHPDSVSFARSIDDDLARRDFTVNAMAFASRTGLIDLFGGRADAESGVIRCVGEPERRFEEDSLRILRALRFYSRLTTRDGRRFTIEPETLGAMVRCAPGTARVSAERINAELCGILLSARAYETLRLMNECGIWRYVCGVGRDILPPEGLDGVPRDIAARMAALLGGFGRAEAERIVSALRFKKGDISRVSGLTDNFAADISDEYALLKLMSRIGEREAGVLIDTRRALGDAAADGARGRLDELAAAGRCYELSRLAVNGVDIAALGYRGREIGDVLRRLLDAVMRGVPNERERLLAMAQNSGDARDKM